ncbi:uncharacterized protein A4U43_C08F22940 [Asparagus officinalis]|nr:uncharacterized protein A4U43_C08F22940 [Asparagus officinalis]
MAPITDLTLKSGFLDSIIRGKWFLMMNLQTRVGNLIRGEFLESRSESSIDVINTATQEVVSSIPLTTDEEFKAAVNVAKKAFPKWKNTPVTSRQRDKLAMNITTEQGKTLKDAQGDVFRGLG